MVLRAGVGDRPGQKRGTRLTGTFREVVSILYCKFWECCFLLEFHTWVSHIFLIR